MRRSRCTLALTDRLATLLNRAAISSFAAPGALRTVLHGETVADRGRDEPFADGPEELAVGGLLPDGNPGGHFPAAIGDIAGIVRADGAWRALGFAGDDRCASTWAASYAIGCPFIRMKSVAGDPGR